MEDGTESGDAMVAIARVDVPSAASRIVRNFKMVKTLLPSQPASGGIADRGFQANGGGDQHSNGQSWKCGAETTTSMRRLRWEVADRLVR